MRLHGKARVCVCAIAVAMFVRLAEAAGPQARLEASPHAAQDPQGRPDAPEIARALEAVRADPLLAQERTIKILRWKRTQTQRPVRRWWTEWIIGAFGWVGESMRVVVWGVVIVFVALVLAYAVHAIRRTAAAQARGGFVAPTHVRDLDIRPETLPTDIGGAARALWDGGNHRAALALLYRGLLSRLVHVHHVPIRPSSTEGDCLVLATPVLSAERHAYAAALVTIWQRAIYGREEILTPAVYDVCDGFARVLDSACVGWGAVSRARVVKRIFIILGILAVTALAVWIGRHTTWEDTPIYTEPTGEARRNPFYALERFAEALGATPTWDRSFAVPPPRGVLVVSSLYWSVNTTRQALIEQWVEGGGRLVVVGDLTGGTPEFARWSGIERRDVPPNSTSEAVTPETPQVDPFCGTLTEEIDGARPTGPAERPPVRICSLHITTTLVTNGTPTWALRDQAGIHVLRVAAGQGHVTVINATPFWSRGVLDDDHGWLFVAATELRRGDDVHFLSEAEYPSLFALVWQNGGPIVGLSLVVIGLVLWRGGVRFGPLLAPPPAARRSLAEQIRGTGWFALHHGGSEALHAACVRALDDAARRRVHGYGLLSASERTAAVARLTGYDRELLSVAIYHPSLRRSQELLSTVALLEGARRLMDTGGKRRTVEARRVEGRADGIT